MENLNDFRRGVTLIARRGIIGLLLALTCLHAHAASAIDAEALLRRPWLKLEMPGLVLVSDASEGQLRDWARQIDTFRRALDVTIQISPGDFENPATIFLFKSDGTLRPLLPRAPDGKPVRAVAFANSIWGHDLAAVSFSGSRLDARERLQHELTHWHLFRAPASAPLWLQEGLAQIFETFVLDRGRIRLGQDRDYIREYVRISGNPPLARLLNTEQLDLSKAGFAHQRTELFYAQSWALMHYLLFAHPSGGFTGVSRFLMALQAGTPQDEAFRRAFGLSVEEAHAALEVHIRTPHWRFYEMPFPRSEKLAAAITPLAGAELELRLATLLAVAGHREIADQILTPLLTRDPNNVTAWEIAGIARHEPKEPGRATIVALSEAFRRGSKNPHVPLLLGLASIETNLREETGCDATELFARALELRPGMPEAYDGAAFLSLDRTSASPRLQAIVEEGARRFPSSANLMLAAAWIDHGAGRDAQAVTRLERLIEQHRDLPMEHRLRAASLLHECQANASSAGGAASAR